MPDLRAFTSQVVADVCMRPSVCRRNHAVRGDSRIKRRTLPSYVTNDKSIFNEKLKMPHFDALFPGLRGVMAKTLFFYRGYFDPGLLGRLLHGLLRWIRLLLGFGPANKEAHEQEHDCDDHQQDATE